MNHIFAEHTTSVAFSLTLSKTQCNTLLRLEGFDPTAVNHGLLGLTVAGLQAIERKGLVYWRRDTHGRASGFMGLTDAGRLALALLKEAGLTIENTNTGAILRRFEREVGPGVERKAA